MKKGPLFPRREKPDVDKQILEAEVRLRALKRKYKVMLERDVRTIRYSRDIKKENPKAVANLKNAYYSLCIVNKAEERLRDITSIHELCKAMNEMGSVLKLMNSISGRTEKVNTRRLASGIKGMDKAAQRDEGGMTNLFREPIDELVDDSIVERLIKGEPLQECLDMEDGILQNMEEILPFTEEFLQNMDGADAIDIDESMANIDELMRDL